MDQFKRTVIAVLQRLRGPAPAAIKDRGGGGNARRMRCIFRPQDAKQRVDCGPGVASRERPYLDNSSLGHRDLGLNRLRCEVLARRRVHPVHRDDSGLDRRAKRNGREIRALASAVRRRKEADHFRGQDSPSPTTIAMRPISASDIRYAVIHCVSCKICLRVGHCVREGRQPARMRTPATVSAMKARTTTRVCDAKEGVRRPDVARRRPIGESEANKKPAAMFARAWQILDDATMPVICPTSQILFPLRSSRCRKFDCAA